MTSLNPQDYAHVDTSNDSYYAVKAYTDIPLFAKTVDTSLASFDPGNVVVFVDAKDNQYADMRADRYQGKELAVQDVRKTWWGPESARQMVALGIALGVVTYVLGSQVV